METLANKNRSEEEYFFREDQEKLRQLRSKLDAERQLRQAEQQRELHWMKCPKCGSNMIEVKLNSILVDKCTGCSGVFFDNGEWNMMVEQGTEEKPSFLTTLHQLLVGEARI